MKKTCISILSAIFALIPALPILAQNSEECVEMSRVNPYYQCNNGPNFNPVCGCDNKTYVSGCAAYNQAGLNWVLHDGVCQNELFFIAFWPNPVRYTLNFHMQFADRKEQDANMQVIDMYGNRVYSKLLNNLSSDFGYMESIPFNDLKTGIYLLVVSAGGVYKIKRFVKQSF